MKLFRYALLVVALLLLPFQSHAQNLSILYHSDPERIIGAVQRFEADHPGVTVEILGVSGGLTDAIITRHLGGSAADIIVHDAGGPVLEFAAQGIITPLDEYYDKDPHHFDAWYPGVFDGVTHFGRRYGVPNVTTALYTYWVNVDRLEENGLVLPEQSWTMDDFVELGQKLVKDTDGDGEADQWIMHLHQSWRELFMNAGGSFTDPEDPRTITVDSPESIEALNWLQKVRQELEIVPQHTFPLDRRQAWHQGVMAMAHSGAWEGSSEVPFRKAVLLPPQGSAGRKNLFTHWAWMVSSQSAHPDLAWELIKYLTDEESQAFNISVDGTTVISRNAMIDHFGHDVDAINFREVYTQIYFDYPYELFEPSMPSQVWSQLRRMTEIVKRTTTPAEVTVEERADSIRHLSEEFWNEVAIDIGM